MNFRKILFCSFVAASFATSSFTYAKNLLVDEWTPGYQALKWQKKNNFWTQLDLMVFDGGVTTNPPGTTRYDRRIQALFNVGGDYNLAKGGLRTSLKVFGSFEKSEEDTEPKVPIMQFIKRIDPAFDYTFINPKGLEITLGYQLLHEFAFDRSIESDLVSQTTSFDAATVGLFRFGMMRRGSGWSGGFYYINGGSTEREVVHKVHGMTDEIQSEETVQVAPEVGIIASFSVYGFLSELDLAMVQASEASDKSADGISVEDDYLKVRFSAFFPVGPGTISASLAHQTLSYSSNAFVTLDTIPQSILKVKYLFGNPASNFFVGGIYGYGDDGLSIPETNESFNLGMIGVTTGMFFSF